jgi:glycosyltransferase involved in cell wall biosynthesis
MLSAIISTYESERSLVPTLAALVPGAATGLLAEVVIADANSHDATAEVADIAGCRFLASGEPLGARLKAAAATTRSPWLLFLRAGATPQSGWIEATDHFIRTSSAVDGAPGAAVFRAVDVTEYRRPRLAEIVVLFTAALGMPKAEQGLLIARRFYDAIGGHGEGANAEKDLLRRIGRRRITLLPAALTIAR